MNEIIKINSVTFNVLLQAQIIDVLTLSEANYSKRNTFMKLQDKFAHIITSIQTQHVKSIFVVKIQNRQPQ